ncbi:hypothetical protein NE237_006908 [Protea cynaroides]|uniref:Uncharacterized protein n=1 Tax=Protea cynaroides TaxID=273540 RepID=A0A9Q0KP23_9MAGN|nr:hypothetical protein NE237_006908 [Protea cynaroides]
MLPITSPLMSAENVRETGHVEKKAQDIGSFTPVEVGDDDGEVRANMKGSNCMKSKSSSNLKSDQSLIEGSNLSARHPMPRTRLHFTAIPSYLNPFNHIANLPDDLENLTQSTLVDQVSNLNPPPMTKSHPTNLNSCDLSSSTVLDRQAKSEAFNSVFFAKPLPLQTKTLNLRLILPRSNFTPVGIDQCFDPGDGDGDSDLDSPRSDAWYSTTKELMQDMSGTDEENRELQWASKNRKYSL